MDDEAPPVKIKIEKRSISEKQKEALEKARKSKLQKKLLTDAKKNEPSSFLGPTPFLLISIGGLGLLGLGMYYYEKSAPKLSTSVPEEVKRPEQAQPQQTAQPQVAQPQSKMDKFLEGSVKI